MNYDVVVADRAAEEFESAARWWAEHRSLNQAERWYDGFIQRSSRWIKPPIDTRLPVRTISFL